MNIIDIQEDFKPAAHALIELIKKGHGVELSYNQKSVDWLDNYIERLRRHFLPKGLLARKKRASQIENFTGFIGSFLGECIIATYGGQWEHSAGGEYCIYLKGWRDKSDPALEHIWLFPFNKVRKQLVNGREDSISSFYSMIPVVYEHSERA